MNALAAVAKAPTYCAEPQGLIRRVADWMSKAPADVRAQAISALARAFLYSGLGASERADAMISLTAALDDSSLLVRRALAEALASAADAPRHIVLALAQDRAEVARVVLARSPALSDADLVDCAALGDASVQTAIARRAGLGAAAAAALAEVGDPSAALALTENIDADIDPTALRRLFERFGEDAALREALLKRPNLPAALRADIATAVAAALADFTGGCGWLDTRRAERVAREAREQTIVTIAREAAADLGGLVARLREDRALTVALLMRSLMSGERGLLARALTDLSAVDERRVNAFLSDPFGRGFSAVYARAGLPAALLPAFRAGLAAQTGETARGDGLSNAITMRTIASLERLDDPALAPVLAMLWRFAGESARADARARISGPDLAPDAPLMRLEPGAFEARPAPALLLELTPESELEDQLALLVENEFAAAA